MVRWVTTILCRWVLSRCERQQGNAKWPVGPCARQRVAWVYEPCNTSDEWEPAKKTCVHVQHCLQCSNYLRQVLCLSPGIGFHASNHRRSKLQAGASMQAESRNCIIQGWCKAGKTMRLPASMACMKACSKLPTENCMKSMVQAAASSFQVIHTPPGLEHDHISMSQCSSAI